jgi:hypothetical protein
MISALLCLLVCQEPTEGGVVTGRDRYSAVQIELSGHFDIHYISRDGTINEAGTVINGAAPASMSGTNAWAGRMSLRADATVQDSVRGVLELENLSFENGINKPFSSNPTQDTVLIKQGYVDAPDFLVSGLDLRVGVQTLTFRNRPQDEAFFMDLGESEAFFDGFNAAGARILNSVDRDVREATGVRLQWSPNDFMVVDGAALIYSENATASRGESVYVLAVNSLLAEHWSAWILATVVTAGQPNLKQIETFGAGIDGYLGAERLVEVFLEIYGQTGVLTTVPFTVRKEAYAFNVGTRIMTEGGWAWIEPAFSERTGDRHPDDHHDQAFQSYENENRFLILQSSEFGLDVDTNVRLARVAVGTGPLALAEGRPLRVQVDVGRFTAMQQLPQAGSSRQWGLETDLSLTWGYNASLSFKFQGAILWDSEVLGALTATDRTQAYLLVVGADFRF